MVQKKMGNISGKKTGSPKYSSMNLDIYDRERHMSIDQALEMIAGEKSRTLPVEKLQRAIDNQDIRVYEFKKGKRYVDRLDVGRVYHKEPREKPGITVKRKFTYGSIDLIEEYKARCKPRDLELKDKDGKIIFQMREAMFPEEWDDNDATIVAQKYFYQPHKKEWKKQIEEVLGVDHEFSPHHVVERITNFIVEEGDKFGYFRTQADKKAFRDELLWLQLTRRFAFNSPVKFNAGLFLKYGVTGSQHKMYWRDASKDRVETITEGEYVHPQCHACFINGPRDDLDSLSHHCVDETSIFSSGSGVGHDLSSIRGENEPLSSGGVASGPLTFAKIYDDLAGTIKSGGKSRRAARMTSLRGGKKEAHPDIEQFITMKVGEDKKALILMRNGYEAGMDGEAYATVTLQNTNISVRVDRDFFDEVEKDGEIELRRVTDGKVTKKVKAREMLKRIAYGSWRIGDPGIQYESPIQEDHTCPNSGRINASNPCSEFMNVDNTSCNLGSHNLVAYANKKGDINNEDLKHGCRISSIALDIINDVAAYPVEEIAHVSPQFRSIGLGFANAGKLLMRKGYAYDSDQGRSYIAAITALMTAAALETSADLSKSMGTFTQYEINRRHMKRVIEKKISDLEKITWQHVPEELQQTVRNTFESARKKGRRQGYRNSQVSLLAPTGTISHFMGCKTTGIEPSLALRIEKELAGGGKITMATDEVENALINLGFEEEKVEQIKEHIIKNNTAVGAPYLTPEQAEVFATSFGNARGIGSIPFEGHVKMLGAVQPFLSGAISKTINFPKSASVKDFYDGFVLGNKLGIKALAAFRDESKPISPYGFEGREYKEYKRGEKEDLDPKRPATEFELEMSTEQGRVPFHVIVSEYRDGRPGQIGFLCYKAGSAVGDILKNAGVSASKSLKRGVHLDDIVIPWLDQTFDPRGPLSGHEHFGSAKSFLDAAAKIILLEYRCRTDLARDPDKVDITKLRGWENGAFETYRQSEIDDWDFDAVMKDPILGGFIRGGKKFKTRTEKRDEEGAICNICGGIMTREKANCYKCNNCSNQIGGCTV